MNATAKEPRRFYAVAVIAKGRKLVGWSAGSGTDRDPYRLVQEEGAPDLARFRTLPEALARASALAYPDAVAMPWEIVLC